MISRKLLAPAHALVALTLFQLGCVKLYHEKRLGEEHWEVGYTEIESCQKTTSKEDCIKALQPKVQEKADQLCGKRLEAALSNCEKDQRRGLYAVVCDVRCQDNNSQFSSSSPGKAKGMTFEEGQMGLKEILNSAETAKVFGRSGIGLIKASSKTSYLLRSADHKVCAIATLAHSENGDLKLHNIVKADCDLFR